MPNISLKKESDDLHKKGFKLIAGTDEVGRGPLAGPVVAAAVILPKGYNNSLIQDSKKISPELRETLAKEIKEKAISFCIAKVNWKQIDEMGILNASKLAMRRAILGLSKTPDFILSDAVALNIMEIPQKAIVKGDEKVLCIAAASILAKVHRDELMLKYSKKHPKYGFEKHMGYGTKVHLNAIKKHGACQIHRKSFSPFKPA